MPTSSPHTVDFTTTSPQTGSKFLSLPPELKNGIYEMVLQDFTVTIEVPDDKGDTALSKGPGILLACKEVYQETWKLYYSTVTIVVPLDRQTRRDEVNDETGRRRLDTFLRAMGPVKSALLTSMVETLDTQPVQSDPHSSSLLDRCTDNFILTCQRKVYLIEHAKRALGRSLLKSWFRSVDGKPQYSTDPVQNFLDWSDVTEMNKIRKYSIKTRAKTARLTLEVRLQRREHLNELNKRLPQEESPLNVEMHMYWSNEPLHAPAA